MLVVYFCNIDISDLCILLLTIYCNGGNSRHQKGVNTYEAPYTFCNDVLSFAFLACEWPNLWELRFALVSRNPVCAQDVIHKPRRADRRRKGFLDLSQCLTIIMREPYGMWKVILFHSRNSSMGKNMCQHATLNLRGIKDVVEVWRETYINLL